MAGTSGTQASQARPSAMLSLLIIEDLKKYGICLTSYGIKLIPSFAKIIHLIGAEVRTEEQRHGDLECFYPFCARKGGTHSNHCTLKVMVHTEITVF